MTTSPFPIDKVLYSALSGSIVVLLVYFIRVFTNIELPTEVVSAITVLVTFTVAYLVPLKESEVKLPTVTETKL